MDIDRLFTKNKHHIIGCSLNPDNESNVDMIIKYLSDNTIITPIINEEDEQKYGQLNDGKNKNKGKISDHKKNSKSFVNIFRRSSNKNNNKSKEVIMIFGLDKSGKSKILDSFGFGKKSNTLIDTLKCNKCQFHALNYHQIHTIDYHQ